MCYLEKFAGVKRTDCPCIKIRPSPVIPRALILLPLILFVACSMSAKFGEGPQAPYQKVTALEDVPEPAKRVLGFYAPNPRDRIADSDSNFTAGCTPLPDHSNRRLVLAGLADDHVLIVQEREAEPIK